MKILIIANARFKGGLSGGDAIHESFLRYWKQEIEVHNCFVSDKVPFFFAYLYKIINGCWKALIDKEKYDFVFSASDFMPDAIPALIYKLKGNAWVSAFFLQSWKDKFLYYYSQKVMKYCINKKSDLVMVTNPTMYDLFPNKKKVWINGGIESHCFRQPLYEKVYDAVFIGRIHPSKGVEHLIYIWSFLKDSKPDAILALIGDGDLGLDWVRTQIIKTFGREDSGIDLLGYMGDERFEIYQRSKCVVYPTPAFYDHFSIAPLEAMACGCPMVSYALETIATMNVYGKGLVCGTSWSSMAKAIELLLELHKNPIDKFAEISTGKLKSYKDFSDEAVEFAREFEYKKESLRVFNDIKKELSL